MQITDRREAIRHIAKLEKGRREDLTAAIGNELYEQFIRLGFIKNCYDGLNPKTPSWKITESGRRQYNFYRAPTEEEAALGRFYHSLGL